ncbi:Integrase catalytic region [Solidesulfovibrio carbinoliphilus subsp. oakridgensis]|uniref:Integrase catalytic region n=1 Tax=Solidesulfovibrio carbinoliphilus subsp. oakridgensis TaxID=694327 RepID=G7QC29_9BACT|nr:integrase core domain-containing protein [Solidesulfovibrio carbinoliphilus]EHJ46064.1 Integrase catalytic region [Solidesulfovibrio carbinoliphilus subsp. oakridgensis]EHJ47771.1 Integrase catalytic region [Solidesulfovibrio carbinoliphilus subsp. oakridgensis]EHJ48067.1 Integrase catalytic region [Solidesulfovibrio carbinoliphilus subsp. oakridgensis]EHJ48169.1 Integrase catalytic region [Solidesulfovibrio carbinoliphilus subsp. oakridgensis]EHJ49292.1 Integrase catalytic region [Solidesu
MPWKKVNPMEERARFIVELSQRRESFAALCRKYGISRETGYKWLRRYQAGEGLGERSRVARHCPHKTPDAVVTLLLALRQENPYWGPKKLVRLLQDVHGIEYPPAKSTAGDILKRHGLITATKAKRRQSGGRLRREDLRQPKQANDVWSADYKGWFRLEDRSICHPLTISDIFSRYVLGCYVFPTQTLERTKEAMRRVFMRYGLPRAIRVDNGTPFGSTGIAGLTGLSVWWLQLGIVVDFIAPGKPEQNGCHERMHRTLKLEATIPPSANLREQQERLESWRERFNSHRPHEALDQATPASIYRPSSRRLPRNEPCFEYPSSFESRTVRRDGMFNWEGRQIFLGEAFAKCRIGLTRNYDDRWLVYLGEHLLGGFCPKDPKRVVPVRSLIS